MKKFKILNEKLNHIDAELDEINQTLINLESRISSLEHDFKNMNFPKNIRYIRHSYQTSSEGITTQKIEKIVTL